MTRLDRAFLKTHHQEFHFSIIFEFSVKCLVKTWKNFEFLCLLWRNGSDDRLTKPIEQCNRLLQLCDIKAGKENLSPKEYANESLILVHIHTHYFIHFDLKPLKMTWRVKMWIKWVKFVIRIFWRKHRLLQKINKNH